MKFRDEDGNEYEIKKKKSFNWRHLVYAAMLLFALISQKFALLIWMILSLIVGSFFPQNEKGEFINFIDCIITMTVSAFLTLVIWRALVLL